MQEPRHAIPVDWDSKEALLDVAATQLEDLVRIFEIKRTAILKDPSERANAKARCISDEILRSYLKVGSV